MKRVKFEPTLLDTYVLVQLVLQGKRITIVGDNRVKVEDKSKCKCCCCDVDD